MPLDKHILVYAEDASVRRTQELMLEAAGFIVMSVGTLREVEYVTSRTVFDLVIIGRAITPPNKIKVAQIVQTKIPNALVLEICDVQTCVDNPDYFLVSPTPAELEQKVIEIFRAKGKKAGG
jgi:DNA-binding NtrC family response regulator